MKHSMWELVLDLETALRNNLQEIRKFRRENNLPLKKCHLPQLVIIANILRKEGKPMHISEIIDIAASEYEVTLKRNTIVSAISKRVKAGIMFVKTGPNEFAIKKD